MPAEGVPVQGEQEVAFVLRPSPGSTGFLVVIALSTQKGRHSPALAPPGGKAGLNSTAHGVIAGATLTGPGLESHVVVGHLEPRCPAFVVKVTDVPRAQRGPQGRGPHQAAGA